MAGCRRFVVVLALALFGPGLARGADAVCHTASFEGDGFTVCAYRPADQQSARTVRR